MKRPRRNGPAGFLKDSEFAPMLSFGGDASRTLANRGYRHQAGRPGKVLMSSPYAAADKHSLKDPAVPTPRASGWPVRERRYRCR